MVTNYNQFRIFYGKQRIKILLSQCCENTPPGGPGLQIVKYRKKENVKRGLPNIEKEFNSRKNQYVFDVSKYGNISELKIILETSQI